MHRSTPSLHTAVGVFLVVWVVVGGLAGYIAAITGHSSDNHVDPVLAGIFAGTLGGGMIALVVMIVFYSFPRHRE